MPRLLRDVLEDLIDSSPDVEVAGEVGAGEALSGWIERTRADVLILSEAWPDDRPTIVRLLDRYPHLRVLVLISDGRQAQVHELKPTSRELDAVSVRELVDVIRRSRASEI